MMQLSKKRDLHSLDMMVELQIPWRELRGRAEEDVGGWGRWHKTIKYPCLENFDDGGRKQDWELGGGHAGIDTVIWGFSSIDYWAGLLAACKTRDAINVQKYYLDSQLSDSLHSQTFCKTLRLFLVFSVLWIGHAVLSLVLCHEFDLHFKGISTNPHYHDILIICVC